MKSKQEIVKENLNLSANEIKKKLRETYPEVKNEEVENLIFQVLKELNYHKTIEKINKKRKEKSKLQKETSDDMER